MRELIDIPTTIVCKLFLIPSFYQAILGKRVIRPANFPLELVQNILKWGAEAGDGFETISANTMGTDCFYEGKYF